MYETQKIWVRFNKTDVTPRGLTSYGSIVRRTIGRRQPVTVVGGVEMFGRGTVAPAKRIVLLETRNCKARRKNCCHACIISIESVTANIGSQNLLHERRTIL